MNTDKKKTSIFYLASFIIITAIEVFIAVFVHDSFIRPYMGDVLVVAVLYSFVRIFIPKECKLLTLYIFIFAVIVEVMQYFNIIKILGLDDITFFRILIGSVFDIKDIICYGIGCMAIGLLQSRDLF